MGLSIEENVATLKEHLNTLNVDKGVEFYQEIESIQSAIDIMRKYQKIEQIYERFQKDGNYYHHMAWLDVMEVLKDENDD